MDPRKVGVIIFEGGYPGSEIEREVVRLRSSVVLDTIETLVSIPGFAKVVLVTNFEDLGTQAESVGAEVWLALQRDFHFGRQLRDVIRYYEFGKVLCMGGGAAPLFQPNDFAWILSALVSNEGIVIKNNVQSADLIAFSPAKVLDEIELPWDDNFLGFLLEEAGLQRIMLPNVSRVNFDLDTPVDFLILSFCNGLGARTRRALNSLTWDKSRLEAALQVLEGEYQDISLLGRVNPNVVNFLNLKLHCRVRTFSEERGMKALGRDARGEAISLVGHFIDSVGPNRFFEYLSSVCRAAFFDTRVLLAHWKLNLPPSDRFNSDVGDYCSISNVKLREFTEAALEADIPVILGGHSLVSGGIWCLAEVAWERRQLKRKGHA